MASPLRRHSLSGGAVYDPDQATWTEIADAPVPIGYGTGAVADGRLYLLITDGGSTHPEVRRAFVSYDPGDVWAELEAPPDDPTLMLAPAGGDIIAYQSTQETASPPTSSTTQTTSRGPSYHEIPCALRLTDRSCGPMPDWCCMASRWYRIPGRESLRVIGRRSWMGRVDGFGCRTRR